MSRILTLSTLLLLGACGGTGSNTAKTTVQDGATNAAPAPGDAKSGLQSVFGMSTIDGKAVDAAPKATAVVVFASWCGNCQRELAHLGELRERYPELRIIGLNAYEEWGNKSDKDRLAAYVAEKAPWLTEIVHADKALLQRFGGVPKIPTSFVYDGQGEVVAEFRKNKGKTPGPGEFEAAVKTALGL